MLCKHYKEALIDAAAKGSQPQGDLRAHLAVCVACRAVFEQEQSLFASIDAGLQATANAEAPTSLLPRVRARIADETTPSRTWFTNWLVLASAAAVLAAFLVTRVVWRPNVRQNPPANSAQTNPAAPVFPPPQEHTQAPEPSAKNNPPPQHPQIFLTKNSQRPGLQSARDTIPEVLVPRNQELLLASYAEQWQARKRAPLVAEPSDATALALLQIAPIQIAQLDVKLLAEEKSQ
jgi:hypothetical protein